VIVRRRFLTDPRPFISLQTVVVAQSVFVDLIRNGYHTHTHTQLVDTHKTLRISIRGQTYGQTNRWLRTQTHSDSHRHRRTNAKANL